MRQQEWASLWSQPAVWRRSFGTGVPVEIVAADPETNQICDIIDRLSASGSVYALVLGVIGTGKSMFVSAAAAALESAAVEHVILNPTEPANHGEFFRSIGPSGPGPVVLIDDCDGCPSTVDRLTALRSKLSGLLLTASSAGPAVVQQMSGVDDVYIPLPHLQQRAKTLLLVASVMWEEVAGAGSNLSSLCDDSATAALIQGPFVAGARSLHDVLRSLHNQLIADGDIVDGVPLRRITRGDVTAALVYHIAPSFAPETATPRTFAVVCEGDTDVTYLRAAAEKAASVRGWNLLEGLQIEAAGAGRAGGSAALTRRVLLLHSKGDRCIGLYDNDEAGRRAARRAKENGLDRVLLPSSFDPLRRDGDQAVVEIEDLLPVDVLVRFYTMHPDMKPQEMHWYSGYWRVVPAGPDKDALASWVSSTCDFSELEAFAYVLCVLRQALQLPMPQDVPPLREWEQRIRDKQAEDVTGGLPHSPRLD